MFKKILIANRGEIAVRIHRACRELGIDTVAVFSEADADALHVKLATEAVCIGKAPAKDSYLNIPALLSAAEITDAQAIHPGYGFLAENAKFSEISEKLGFTFIGPKPHHIRDMGDKITALAKAREYGLPTIPGSNGPVADVDTALQHAERIGYPVILKAAAGGGGRGMKVAHAAAALRTAFNVARNEAQAAFGDGRVYLEKFLQNPRHIEVQVLGDQYGKVSILGERDCSIQRRHQKIIEEAPAPNLSKEERKRLFDFSHAACTKMGYLGAGTLEYLYENGEFYFIEMNTRLQVEHPVTELTTGQDLVQWQIKIAAGEPLNLPQTLTARGHSIECRINAEDPVTFTPCPGQVTQYYPPGGPGVRIDSALYPGYRIPPYYDATVGKLIVHAPTRADAINRMQRALEEFIIEGIKTNIPLHRRVMNRDVFKRGEANIHFLEDFLAKSK